MVSAGELGTNPRELETFLQQILDLANRWQAVLLLDEADVFLEARTSQDLHRNALVSIFLRLLEYFQGILFLTTNRVATFGIYHTPLLSFTNIHIQTKLSNRVYTLHCDTTN